MGGFNLPDDVTDAMIDERYGGEEECEECDRAAMCPFDYDLAECLADDRAEAADRACDAAKEDGL